MLFAKFDVVFGSMTLTVPEGNAVGAGFDDVMITDKASRFSVFFPIWFIFYQIDVVFACKLSTERVGAFCASGNDALDVVNVEVLFY